MPDGKCCHVGTCSEAGHEKALHFVLAMEHPENLKRLVPTLGDVEGLQDYPSKIRILYWWGNSNLYIDIPKSVWDLPQ